MEAAILHQHQALVTFKAALYLSPFSFGSPVDTITMFGGVDTDLGTMH